VDFLLLWTYLQNKTDTYIDFHEWQHVLNFLIVCTHLQEVAIFTNLGIYLFYHVGVYILSENSDNVVIYANHYIYMYFLLGVNVLLGNPEHVVIYANYDIYMFYLVGVYIQSGNREMSWISW
jgi:hypothetical protein